MAAGIPALADSVTYTYIGAAFGSNSNPILSGDQLEATFTTASPLGDNLRDAFVSVSSWSMSWVEGSKGAIGSGIPGSSLNPANPIQVWTNASGKITGWLMDGKSLPQYLNVEYIIANAGGLGGGSEYDEYHSGNTYKESQPDSDDPATWTASNSSGTLWSECFPAVVDAPTVTPEPASIGLIGLGLMGSCFIGGILKGVKRSA